MKQKHVLWIIPVVLLLSLPGCAGKSSRQARLQNLGNGICRDTVSGQMWQIEKSKKTSNLEEAEQYVRALRLGGYSDWRLPTTDELYDLNNFFDLFQNGDCTLDREGNYWSNAQDDQGKAGAWEISGNLCEPARQYRQDAKGYIRAVRP